MKKTWTIDVSKVPENITVQKYILQQTNISECILKFSQETFPIYQGRPLNFDYHTLKNDLLKSLKTTSSYPFKYKSREAAFESYLSTAMTYNPDAIDGLSEDPHAGGLGSSMYSEGNASHFENQNTLKNTYGDSYSLNYLTPLAEYGKLDVFLKTFKRTLIRSRISIIKAQREETTQLNYLWHQVESVFFNLRVNVPILSSENYAIQILEDVGGRAKMTEFPLIPGNAYIYNTELYHRPFCKTLTSEDRINLICGVVLWFNYFPEENVWRSNEFFGEIHPFEMFSSGLISSSF